MPSDFINVTEHAIDRYIERFDRQVTREQAEHILHEFYLLGHRLSPKRIAFSYRKSEGTWFRIYRLGGRTYIAMAMNKHSEMMTCYKIRRSIRRQKMFISYPGEVYENLEE